MPPTSPSATPVLSLIQVRILTSEQSDPTSSLPSFARSCRNSSFLASGLDWRIAALVGKIVLRQQKDALTWSPFAAAT